MAFELEERRMDVSDIRLGMFVCRLDRPWEDSPFPLQGIELSSEEDLRAIREICEFVYIDLRRQLPNYPRQTLTRTSLSGSRFKSAIQYVDKVSIEQE
ncbi:MAG: DUF3391 domain-containing protein, partial [Rhodanobacter sp.]